MQKDLPMHMLNAILHVNDSQPYQVVDILEREIPQLSKQTVLVLGLAFKPGTDDVRDSASLKIVQSLLAKGARVLAHDPVAMDNFKRALGAAANSITFVDKWTNHVAAADVIVVATRWSEYERVAQLDLTGKVL